MKINTQSQVSVGSTTNMHIKSHMNLYMTPDSELVVKKRRVQINIDENEGTKKNRKCKVRNARWM